MSLAKEVKLGLEISHLRHSELVSESSKMLNQVQHDRTWGEIKFRPLVEKLANPKIVGFDAMAEVSSAVKNFRILISEGGTKEEAAENSFSEIAENLRSWDEEFNKEKSVFSANYTFGLYEGKVRILDKTGLPVADKIKKEERQGKALSGWAEAEEFLTAAPDNSLVIINSPKYESGLFLDGGHLNYEDSYFQFVVKVNDQVMFFTVRTFAEVEACRKIQEELVNIYKTDSLIRSKSLTRYDEVSNIVGSPLKLSSADNPVLSEGLENFVWNFLSLINSQEINIFGKGKSLSGAYNEFLERQKGLKLDFKKQPLIDELKEFYFSVLNQLHIPEVQELLAEKLKDVLRKLTLIERGELSDYKEVLTFEQKEKAHGYMQTMHGCSGVGSKKEGNALISVLGGLREVSESEDWHLGECGKCGAGKEDPKVEVSCGLCRSCINSLKEMEKLGLAA